MNFGTVQGVWGKKLSTVLKAAEIVEPGCAITRAELIEYLNESIEQERHAPTTILTTLEKAALKVIALNAL